MRYRHAVKFPSRLLAALIAGALAIHAQDDPAAKEHASSHGYHENAKEFRLDRSAIPAQARPGYRLFQSKCAECHSLNRLRAKSDLSPDEWGDILYRMQDMVSSHLNTEQTKAILSFVVWDDKTRVRQQASTTIDNSNPRKGSMK